MPFLLIKLTSHPWPPCLITRSAPTVAVNEAAITTSSATLVVSPAGGAASTVQYDKFVVTVCAQGSTTDCVTPNPECAPSGAGASCSATAAGLTSGAAYTASAVALKGASTSMASIQLVFAVLFT